MRDGELFFVWLAMIEYMKFIIHHVDFQEWKMNHRDGKVEVIYLFDERNTSRLCESPMTSLTKHRSMAGFFSVPNHFLPM